MATKTVQSENQDRELKHLGFIKIAAIRTLILATNLYEYAKSNSGLLRSGVSKVESGIAIVSSPVRQKVEGAADDLLVFLDREVDEVGKLYEQRVPPLVKTSISQAQVLFQKILQLVHGLTTKAHQAGSATQGTKGMASNYKRVVGEQAVRIWFALNQVPLFHLVTEIAVPTAAHWSEKYNHLVRDMAQKGYTIFFYFPLVPLNRIAKAFRRKEEEKKKAA